MNAIRFWIVAILACAIIGGGVMYYQLVYAGYAELNGDEVGEIQLLTTESRAPAALMLENVKGIDTVEEGVRLSGAISFRACFDTSQTLDTLQGRFEIAADPVPLTAPSWFDCFDAQAIGAALESGEAVAFMSVENITYGVDRIVAIFPAEAGVSRGYVWHQLNACGTAVFAGDNTPDGCPTLPEDT